jgi:uncharacterized membrane protein
MKKHGWYAASLLLIITLSTSTIYSVRAPDPIRRKITGQVLDSKTNKPIFRAGVILYSKNKAISRFSRMDKNGNFVCTNMPEGVYDIKIAHKYYLDKWYRNIRVPDSGVVPLKKIWIIPRPNFKELAREDSIKRTAILKEKQNFSIGVRQIVGRVLEEYSLEPFIDARARLLFADGTSAKMGAVTDAKGNFSILNVSPGTYQVEISYGPTYTKHISKDVKVQPNLATDLGTVLLSEQDYAGDTLY